MEHGDHGLEHQAHVRLDASLMGAASRHRDNQCFRSPEIATHRPPGIDSSPKHLISTSHGFPTFAQDISPTGC